MVDLNPFEQYRDAIFVAAAERYRAERADIEPDDMMSRVVLPKSLDPADPGAYLEALRAEAEVNVAARTVTRLALLQDTREKGGVKGLVAGLESRLTRLTERKYVRGALKAGGLVEMIRVTQGPTDVRELEADIV